MAKTHKTEPVKLIAGLLYADTEIFLSTLNTLEGKFGPVQHETEPVAFTFTDYYRKEMGSDLKRCFISFENPVSPEHLADIKVATNKLESRNLNDSGGRKINIDPGLISLANLVLASTKDFAHRIYLGQGIYGEVSLLYENRAFIPLPWTYPDYHQPATIEFLVRVRESLKEIIIPLREKGNELNRKQVK